MYKKPVGNVMDWQIWLHENIIGQTLRETTKQTPFRSETPCYVGNKFLPWEHPAYVPIIDYLVWHI